MPRVRLASLWSFPSALPVTSCSTSAGPGCPRGRLGPARTAFVACVPWSLRTVTAAPSFAGCLWDRRLSSKKNKDTAFARRLHAGLVCFYLRSCAAPALLQVSAASRCARRFMLSGFLWAPRSLVPVLFRLRRRWPVALPRTLAVPSPGGLALCFLALPHCACLLFLVGLWFAVGCCQVCVMPL